MPFCTNCGEKFEDDQKVCAHCGKSLEMSEDKKNSEKNFYVPVDFSDVREAIPVGEDIIYSSLFSVFTHGADPFAVKSQQFQSHVLFTKKGIAYQEPKLHLMKSNYLPWYKVNQITVATIMFKKGTKINTTMYVYTMIPDTNYESLKDFDMRTWRFFFEFVPHVIDEKMKHRSTEGLKKLQKTYHKIKKVLGEEECEFLRTNNDYEEFEKHLPFLKKAMLEVTPKWAQFLVRKYL